jgi:hypothetical protein
MSTGHLVFDYIYVDTATLDPKEFSAICLFQDEPSTLSSRITDQDEQILVRWLLSNDMRRQRFLSNISNGPGRYRDSIMDKEFPLSSTPKGGDIDLVLLEGDSLARAVCVEFKKVKVRIDSNGKELVNGLGGLKKLIAQGNARQSQGFWKTYICAVAVIDKHDAEAANVFARRPESQEILEFYNLISSSGIHPEVGVILMEVSQPTRKAYESMFGLGTCKVREAGVLEQPIKLTEDLQTVFRKPAGGQA